MKTAFTIINILLVAAMAYFCVDMIYKNAILENLILPAEQPVDTKSKNINVLPEISVVKKDQYNSIISRNLFKVDVEQKNEPPVKEIENKEPEKLEPTTLKLGLWGTVTGDSEVYAVIEDKQIRQQSLYQVGDLIQGAKLKQISRYKVILTYQGKDQILEMETDRKTVSNARIPKKKIGFNAVNLSELVVGNELTYDLPDSFVGAMKQIKFRPHFAEGEPDGLMVYGIRPNSVFKQMGLMNGDIIKNINGTQIETAEDASSLFTEVEGAENINVTLLRRGEIKELVYQVNKGDSPPGESILDDNPPGVSIPGDGLNRGDE